jgi:hypothetical protein
MKLITKIALSWALIMSSGASAAAVSDLDTKGADWVNTTTNNYINVGPASETLPMVNFLLCAMEMANVDTHVNQTYMAMIDENLCNGKVASTPAFATQTLVTSRTDNSAPYLINSWIETASGGHVVAAITVTSAPTEAVPRGVATMTWNQVDPTSGAVEQKGILTTHADNTLSYVQFVDAGGSNDELSFLHGSLSGDGSTGSLRVGIEGKVYGYEFDEDHLKHDDLNASNAQCLSRAPANMVTRNLRYMLFTAAGAEVKLSGPFAFNYDDASKRGWAGRDGVWLQGGETGSNRPVTITRNSNEKVYDVCWGSDCTNGTTGDDYGLSVDNSLYKFDSIIQLQPVDARDPSNTSNPVGSAAAFPSGTAEYAGAGSTLGLKLECYDGQRWQDGADYSGCYVDPENDPRVRPQYDLSDKTELSDGTTSYFVKAIDSEAELGSSSDCAASFTSVPAHDANLIESTSIPTITGMLWLDKPPVTTPQVIHGVEQ